MLPAGTWKRSFQVPSGIINKPLLLHLVGVCHLSHRSATKILYFNYMCIFTTYQFFLVWLTFFFIKLVKMFWDSYLTNINLNLISPIHFNLSFPYQVSTKSIRQFRSWTFKWLATTFALRVCFCFTRLIQITPRKLSVTYLFSMTCLPLFINCRTLQFWHCIKIPYTD